MNPQTLAEWEAYVSRLTANQLWSKTRALNSLGFIRILQSEGQDPDHTTEVFKLFKARFVALGLEPPTGGYIDLMSI